MKEVLLVLLTFGVVAMALINLKPAEVVKETVVKEVVKEVPVKERVVVKEVVKETPVIYKTVNHYHDNDCNHNVVYYELPGQESIQRVSYKYFEPIEEKEVKSESEKNPKRNRK